MRAVARRSTKQLLAAHLSAIVITLLGTLALSSERLCRGSSGGGGGGGDAALPMLPSATTQAALQQRQRQQPAHPLPSSGCEAPALGLRSRRWAPLALSACSPTMPTHWAPCLVGGRKDPALAHAEELIYPDFSIPEPGFALEEHGAWWRAQVAAQRAQQARQAQRFVLRGGRALYLGQHGQALLLRNVAFDGTELAAAAGRAACMARNASHRGFAALPRGEGALWDRALLAGAADSHSTGSGGSSSNGSLKHFLSHTAKLLVQAEGWRQQQGTRIVVPGAGEGAPAGLLADVWAQLLQAGGKQQVLASEARGSATELVFPCRCPRVHPFFPARLLELLDAPEPAPLAQRKTVLYVCQGGGGASPGVANEAAILAAVAGVLQERGRGEQLAVFNASEPPRLAELLRHMSASVAAVVGPSGGALFCAAWFAPPDALVLELMPTGSFSTQIWEEGSLLGRRMWVLPCEPAGGLQGAAARPPNGTGSNVEAPLTLVARILREQLGVPPLQVEPRLEYDWDLEQLL